MKPANQSQTISDYNDLMGVETLHPLVSVIDFSKVSPIIIKRKAIEFYAIFFKDAKCGDILYGRNKYDYREGTLLFMAPNQIIEVENNGEPMQPKGWAVLFHPDLLKGMPLAHKMKEYTFFSYEVHEALNLSEQEKQIVSDCIQKIEFELHHTIDKHSCTLIATNIELLLNYCVRFYDRQFITRNIANKDILTRFENLLNNYFESELPLNVGFPTVKYCAEQLHLSSNYFGDLIRKETGKTAQDYVQHKIINLAKERIFDSSKSVSEIAYELGFQYPQHFSRFFKKKTGFTPNEYRLKH